MKAAICVKKIKSFFLMGTSQMSPWGQISLSLYGHLVLTKIQKHTPTQLSCLLFAISTLWQQKSRAFMLRPPRSQRLYPTGTAPFHKSHLLPVSQMKLRPSEGYYSHSSSLPSPVPCTITVFKGSHSYLCSFPTFPFPFLSLCLIFSLCIGPLKKKRENVFTKSRFTQPLCPVELAGVCYACVCIRFGEKNIKLCKFSSEKLTCSLFGAESFHNS